MIFQVLRIWSLIVFLTTLMFFKLQSQTSQDSTGNYEKRNSFTSIFYGDPGKAALYSLVLPGAGQLYNKRWWKAPLVWAGEGFLIWNLNQSLSEFNQIDQCWRSIVEDPTAVCQGFNVNSASEAFTIRQRAQSNRELAWIFLSAGHLISVLEAFVDRHLINFDTSDQLSIRVGPPRINQVSSNPTRFQIPPTVDLITVSLRIE